ncbi:uncharacterized protein HLK63_K09757 [Nakaseomyces glabratus]|nr:uncharacterized protein GW608_K09757 [Nakaseomyces glabratus]UCS27691.1 uncharacterized protein HLK63_K09757 [Nakaseomyces glabratus]UCS32920.1 uncharacterized protein HLK64_K09757 [Nakaseomyces glabratus]UCS38149.1 uncharacterized protein HLK62_K09757 [Nakaseomyces glabratus]
MEHVRNFYDTILRSSHPLLMAFHLAGKAAPLAFYIAGFLFPSFTALFITIVLLLAADFYFTKNISGRRLVQLRWWYDSSATSTETFTFESHKQYTAGPPINPIDSKLFWWSMYLTPAIWFVLGILAILRLKLITFILIAVATCMTGWNTYGFRCCDRWNPNNSQSTEPFFQLPSIPGLDNITRLARFQSFFQSAAN